MAYIEDLTFTNAAGIADTDILYIGKPGDIDPDRRTSISELAAKLIGPSGEGLVLQSGAFNPTLVGSSSNPSVTYSLRAGRYVRVGPLVWFSLSVSTSSFSGGSGNLYIGGLPFTAQTPQNPVVNIRTSHISIPAQHIPYGYVRAGESSLALAYLRDNAAILNILVGDWGSNSQVNATGVYEVQ